jgi:hypothetical protein
MGLDIQRERLYRELSALVLEVENVSVNRFDDGGVSCDTASFQAGALQGRGTEVHRGDDCSGAVYYDDFGVDGVMVEDLDVVGFKNSVKFQFGRFLGVGLTCDKEDCDLASGGLKEAFAESGAIDEGINDENFALGLLSDKGFGELVEVTTLEEEVFGADIELEILLTHPVVDPLHKVFLGV